MPQRTRPRPYSESGTPRGGQRGDFQPPGPPTRATEEQQYPYHPAMHPGTGYRGPYDSRQRRIQPIHQSHRRDPQQHSAALAMEAAYPQRDSFGGELDSQSFNWNAPFGGSFGDSDSPPRRPSPDDDRKPSPRLSPGYYRRVPPGPPQPVDPYGYWGRSPAQGYGYHPAYYEGHEAAWPSPPAVEDSFTPPAPAASPNRDDVKTSLPNTETPEKSPKRSMFRSPTSKLRSSPYQASPNLSSASFGMTGSSPDGHLTDNFSPLGPSATYFDAVPRTNSGEFTPQKSPYAGYAPQYSNLSALDGVAPSPVQSSLGRPPASHVTLSNRSVLRTSPVARSNDVKPTKLWHETPRSMRLELGRTGPQAGTQRTFDGINNRMRQPPSTATRVDRYGAHPYSSPYHARLHGTPSKSFGQHHPDFARQPRPGEKASLQYHPPPSTAAHGANKSDTVLKPSPASAKHTKSSSSKSGICNCKKSKCLKLYCECFSAKKYCKGCKCVDCGNLPAFEALREKAINDAKSKNPAAFKQQTGGCRCKKSCCLKKYCECFEAREFCVDKCKCVGCANYEGSQRLIDKRRKMNDLMGAEKAVRASHDVWSSQLKQSKHPSRPPPRMSMASPSAIHRMSGRMQPHAFPHHPPYGAASVMGPHGYPNMAQVTPYGRSSRPSNFPPVPQAQKNSATSATTSNPSTGLKRPVEEVTPSPQMKSRPKTVVSPPRQRSRPTRLYFDPSKHPTKTDEDSYKTGWFGNNNPAQPRRVANVVCSFLRNADLFRMCQVNKSWNAAALDKELVWQFPNTSSAQSSPAAGETTTCEPWVTAAPAKVEEGEKSA